MTVAAEGAGEGRNATGVPSLGGGGGIALTGVDELGVAGGGVGVGGCFAQDVTMDLPRTEDSLDDAGSESFLWLRAPELPYRLRTMRGDVGGFSLSGTVVLVMEAAVFVRVKVGEEGSTLR